MSESDAAEEADYVIGPDGRLHFTEAGRAFHTAYFGYAGIDIRRIATEADFKQACHQAFPYLFAFMASAWLRNPRRSKPAPCAPSSPMTRRGLSGRYASSRPASASRS
jgi:hypothetical protein